MSRTCLKLKSLTLKRHLLLELVAYGYTVIAERFQALHVILIAQIDVMFSFGHHLKKHFLLLIKHLSTIFIFIDVFDNLNNWVV